MDMFASSLDALADPFLFEPELRSRNGPEGPATRAETAAVAAALARLVRSDSSIHDTATSAHAPATAYNGPR